MPAFVPEPPPETNDVSELRRYCYEMFQLVSDNLELLTQGRFDVLTAAPAKPRDGMIVYADGTTWNPGSGKGTYEYRSGAWVKL